MDPRLIIVTELANLLRDHYRGDNTLHTLKSDPSVVAEKLSQTMEYLKNNYTLISNKS